MTFVWGLYTTFRASFLSPEAAMILLFYKLEVFDILGSYMLPRMSYSYASI
jgi:hypothetical protein